MLEATEWILSVQRHPSIDMRSSYWP